MAKKHFDTLYITMCSSLHFPIQIDCLVLVQLLAEAEKELANGSRDNEDSQTPNTPQVTAGKDTIGGGKAHDGSEENWVKLLDPIAKLPTNVGSRIRNRVRDALEAGPPEWAVELLEQSISKKVYKGNASGPTKVNPRCRNSECTCLF